MKINPAPAGDVSNLGFLLGLKQAQGVDAVHKTGITVSFFVATRHNMTFIFRCTRQPLAVEWVHFERESKSWRRVTYTWHLTRRTSTRKRRKSYLMLLIWISHCDFFNVPGNTLNLFYNRCWLWSLGIAFSHMKFTETPVMSESRTEYKLKSPPEDGITNVTFGPNSSQAGTEKTYLWSPKKYYYDGTFPP